MKFSFFRKVWLLLLLATSLADRMRLCFIFFPLTYILTYLLMWKWQNIEIKRILQTAMCHYQMFHYAVIQLRPLSHKAIYLLTQLQKLAHWIEAGPAHRTNTQPHTYTLNVHFCSLSPSVDVWWSMLLFLSLLLQKRYWVGRGERV